MTHSKTVVTKHVEVYQAEFCDIDEYAQSFSGHEVRSFQLGKGVLNIKYNVIGFHDLVVRRFRTNLNFEDTFFVQPSWTTFSLSPGADVANAVWCGVQSVPNAIGIMRSGREHHCCIPGGWDALEIDMPDELLISEGIVPEQLHEKAMFPEEGILPLSVKSAYRLRHMLQSLFDDSNTISRVTKDYKFASALHQQVLIALANTLEGSTQHKDQRIQRHPYKHYSLMRQINNKIGQQHWKNLTVESLANDLGVTERTLQRIFKEHYQTSPYQYLLCRRLNAARTKLQHSHLNTCSIAAIAEHFGFSSSSKFSEHYKKMFGELPSITIKRQSNKC